MYILYDLKDINMVKYQSRTEGPGWLRLLLITILMSLALV